MKNELPLLIWLTRKDINEALFHQIKTGNALKQRTTISNAIVNDLYRVQRKLLRKVEYLSVRDQDKGDRSFGKRRNKKSMVTLDQLELLRSKYMEVHPDEDAETTTLEELFYWYKINVRQGTSVLD